MTRFIQVHQLTSYPPGNMNRDDMGSPKSAKMGGYDRLRVSSQCLKRTWRTSDVFQAAMADHIGERTKLLGIELFKHFIENGIEFKKALEWTIAIAGVFGKPESPTDLKKKKDSDKDTILKKLIKKWVPRSSNNVDFSTYSLEQLNSLEAVEISQLSFVSPEEKQDAFSLADQLISDNTYDYKKDLKLLRSQTQAVDIALFGRMLADSPDSNIEAACQVAHAISVHSVVIEDDYFTAVDDLSGKYREDAGAAHIGETRFAAGLFYSYICINRELLIRNLGGNKDLADKAICALTEAAVKISPEGKQNSFASRAYASYVLAEKGDQQPRSLSVAFLKPINPNENEDFLNDAIAAITCQREGFDSVYGNCAEQRYELSVPGRQGTLAGLLDFLGN